MEGFTKEGKIMIQVDSERYEKLITAEAKLKILQDTLFIGADMSWSKDRLSFDETAVSSVARALFPHSYEMKLDELAKEQEEEE